MANEIGYLFQVIMDIEGTYMCLFVHRHEVPQDSKVTYSQILCEIRPQKKETHIVQITVGGYKVTYNSPVSTPTSYLTTSKLHWNSALSIPNGKYLIVDVKNFYLKIQLRRPNITRY